ncbi:MAG TPA: arylsulfatase [Gammaproteobacteria bacterium]
MTNKLRFFLAAVFFALQGCAPGNPGTDGGDAPPSAGTRPPNILLIVADDMGYTDIGSFGGEIPTPNLDALAMAGVRLANFHAAPVCAPARAMLLSGMDNHEAGIGSMDVKREYDFGSEPSQDTPGYAQPGYEGYLSYRVAALPEVLRDTGYHTYMAGKWDLGRALVEEHNPAGRGFESSFVQTTGTALHLRPADGGAHGGIDRADPLVYRENWEIVQDLPPDYFSTEHFTDKIIEYIGANQGDGRPFFAYLALTAPHWPMQAPADWRDRYAGRYSEGYDVIRDRRAGRAQELGVLPADPDMDGYRRQSTPWSELGPGERAEQERRMEIFAAMMGNMDFHIGRLMDYLRETDQLEDTFILFMSDNGASGSFPRNMAAGYDNSLRNIGDRDSFIDIGRGWAEAAMAPFRDVKGAMAEGGVRAAAFATHGSLANPGSISRAYLTMQDVMPTLLEVAGAEHPGSVYMHRPVLPMRGASFLGHLRGEAGAVHEPDEVIGWELSGQRALVRGDWKLLWMPNQDGETRWELFDLGSDPYERDDLSAARPELLIDLVDAWYDYADDVGVAVIE